MISFLSDTAVILGVTLFMYFSWRKIEMGITAVIFFLPLYLVRLNILGIPTTALELGIYILFTIWLFKNYRVVILWEIITDKILLSGTILLFAGAITSTLFSPDLRVSAGILKGWFFDPFLFFIVLISQIKTLEQKENILKTLYFSGLTVALISLAGLIFPKLGGVTYDGRLSGFYLSPNYLAMYLSPALLIGFWLIFKTFGADVAKVKKESVKFFLNVVSFVVIASAIYFTYSYAAWFSLFAAIVLFLYLVFPGSSKKVFLGVVVFLIFGAVVVGQIGTDKFRDLRDLSYRSSYNSRLMIWRSAIAIGKDNFLIGIGPGNFQKYYLDYQKRFSEPYLEWAVPEPHNIFLAFWLETGVLGLLGFLMILFWFFKHGFNLLRNKLLDKENFLKVTVLFSIMVYTIVHGLFDTTYWKNDLAIIFWIILALLFEIKKQPELG